MPAKFFRYPHAAAALAATLLCAGPAQAGTLRYVCNGSAGCPEGFEADGDTQFDVLGQATASLQDGDTLLVWPGTYEGEAIVSANDVTVRGMDRYGVLLDGHDWAVGTGLQGGRDDGAVIYEDITFENMSGKGFKRQVFFWVNVKGYFGRYLTAYDNDLYAIYAFASDGDPNAVSEFRYSYASGNHDSGFYIGGCFPCNVRIDTVWSEYNLRGSDLGFGYSGTNAGGNLSITGSEWNHNRVGLLPNTLTSEPAYPQRAGQISGNLIHDNGNGIGVAGGWENQIFGNQVYDNAAYGIATLYLITPPIGNRVFSNLLWGNSYDLGDLGPGGVNNCFSKNEHREGGTGPASEPSSDPPNLQLLSSCGNPVQAAQNPTGVPRAFGVDPRFPGDNPTDAIPTPATPLTTERTNTELRRAATACMPDPCAGLPENLFCPDGSVHPDAVSPECTASTDG